MVDTGTGLDVVMVSITVDGCPPPGIVLIIVDVLATGVKEVDRVGGAGGTVVDVVGDGAGEGGTAAGGGKVDDDDDDDDDDEVEGGGAGVVIDLVADVIVVTIVLVLVPEMLVRVEVMTFGLNQYFQRIAAFCCSHLKYCWYSQQELPFFEMISRDSLVPSQTSVWEFLERRQVNASCADSIWG